ncbi:O-antigen ligase family protein [Catenovulum sp. SX2]|uniref:O-antigen ligase family protein n=1 Tax=Catenovulum sp. SX2 TaxID=3398614 RepID=UPI003F867B42
MNKHNIFQRHQFMFLLIVFGLIIFDGYRIRIDTSFSIKPFLLICVVLSLWVLRKRILIPLHFGYFLLWYASLFIPLIFGSVLSWSQYVVILTGHALLTAFLLSAYNFIIYKQFKLIDMFDAIVLLGIICAVVGILQLLLFAVGINIGISHFDDIGVPRAESFFSETDWHAMFVGYCLLAAYFTPSHSRFYRYKSYILWLLVFALLSSFGRTAILGVITAFVLYKISLQSFQQNIAQLTRFIVVAIPIFIVFLLIAPESVVTRFDVFSNLENPELDAGAINSRLFAINMTLDFIQQNPFSGNGAGSLNYLAYDEEIRNKYAYGGGINSGRGGTNIFLTALFDAGIFGLLILILLLWKLIFSSYWYARFSQIEINYFLKFIFLGNIYFLVECQANNMIRMPICWINLTLFCYATLVSRQAWQKCM